MDFTKDRVVWGFIEKAPDRSYCRPIAILNISQLFYMACFMKKYFERGMIRKINDSFVWEKGARRAFTESVEMTNSAKLILCFGASDDTYSILA